MIDFDRNLSFSDGQSSLISGSAALKQRLENRLGTQQGEWSYNIRHGVPWLFSVLGESGDSAAIRQLILEQISPDPEVESVGEFTVTFNPETRKIVYQLPIRAANGDEVRVG